MIFYTAGTEVDIQYLWALLQAEKLFGAGLPCLPHGQARNEYEAFLSGDLEVEPLADASKPAAPPAKLEADGCGLPAMADRAAAGRCGGTALVLATGAAGRAAVPTAPTAAQAQARAAHAAMPCPPAPTLKAKRAPSADCMP